MHAQQNVMSIPVTLRPLTQHFWFCLCPTNKTAVRPVVVQHDTVGRLIVAQTDMVVQLGKLLTQCHQLILSCI